MSLKRIQLFDEFITENYSTICEDKGISKGYNSIKTSMDHGETEGTTREEPDEQPNKKPVFATKHSNPEGLGTDDVQPEENS